MNARNTMGKREFIGESIFWSLIMMCWYRKTLFRCIGGMDYLVSKLILWGMLIIFLTLGTVISFTRRNGINVFTSISLPYGIYTVMTYRSISAEFIRNIMYAAVIFAVLYIILVMGRKIKQTANTKRIVKRRIRCSLIGAKNIVVFGMSIIMSVYGINSTLGSSVIGAPVEFASKSTVDEQTIANNIGTVLLLQENEWKELTVKEKLRVLQKIADIEQRYLGIPTKISVGAANTGEFNLGYYNEHTREIIINMDSLLNDSPKSVLDTLCHEAYHCYQYEVVALYREVAENAKKLRMFQNAVKYAEEFSDYVDGKEDFGTYYGQKCERDAREYAEIAVAEYYTRIREYIAEEG